MEALLFFYYYYFVGLKTHEKRVFSDFATTGSERGFFDGTVALKNSRVRGHLKYIYRKLCK